MPISSEGIFPHDWTTYHPSLAVWVTRLYCRALSTLAARNDGLSPFFSACSLGVIFHLFYFQFKPEALHPLCLLAVAKVGCFWAKTFWTKRINKCKSAANCQTEIRQILKRSTNGGINRHFADCALGKRVRYPRSFCYLIIQIDFLSWWPLILKSLSKHAVHSRSVPSSLTCLPPWP